jgi:hydrogenase maturation protease
MNPTTSVLLLIAYGNTLRRDDGAGLALAAQLAQVWRRRGITIRHLALQQLMPELAMDLCQADVRAVVFVDTMSKAAAAIRLQSIAPAELGRVLGHHLTPETLLLYAQRLYGYYPPSWLMTIPGHDFGFGEGFSRETRRLLATAPIVAHESWKTIVATTTQLAA